MQIALDTALDSPALMLRVAALLEFAAEERVGASPLVIDPTVPAGTIKPAEFLTGMDMAAVGFGKAPLPEGAIAIEMPSAFTDSFVRPVDATPVASATAASAAPALTTAPTSASPVTTTTGGTEDSDGYTWDARIHSSSKKRHNDGRWHQKRGVSPELVAKVKAELRAAETSSDVPPPPPVVVTPATARVLNFPIAPPPAAVPPPPPFIPAVPIAQPVGTIAAAPVASAIVTGTPALAAPPPAVPVIAIPIAAMTTTSPSSPISSFKELMAQVITPAMTEKRITPTEIATICKGLGFANGLPDLVPTHPDIGKVVDAVRRHIGAAA